MSSWLSSFRYTKVSEAEGSTASNEQAEFQSEDDAQHRRRRGIYGYLVVLLLFTQSITLGWLAAHNPKSDCQCFDEQLLGAPIVWEEVTYKSNVDGYVDDIYSQTNPNVDAVWESLMEDDMTVITEAERRRLPSGSDTARLETGEEGYAVILDAFHQLHCLNSIRQEFWGGKDEAARPGFRETGGHADHCFSYLVQTLRCHADVGVMTTRWDERHQVFHANFNVTKQCRNYDVIHDWARGRIPKELEATAT